MPHPDRQAALPKIEPEYVDDHVMYDMPVFFSKGRPKSYVTVLWYEDGTLKLAFRGEAITELERRSVRRSHGH